MVGSRLGCLVRLRRMPAWMAPPPARLSWTFPGAVARRTLRAACRVACLPGAGAEELRRLSGRRGGVMG
eukprot:1284327-Alexandrium_andersonii.AAC.1